MKIKPRLLATQALVMFLVYVLPLFIPAGIQGWPAAWMFLLLWFGGWLILLAWLSRSNPALLRERMRIQAPDQKGWDKLAGPLIYVSIFAWLLFTSYDAVRFHWSPVAPWFQALGALILICSFYVYFLTFRENSYLSPLVRVQLDRGQQVVSAGPYHYVRHPMYAATLIFVVGTSLLLGAWYGILAGLAVALTLAWRAVLEEGTLRKELPGYADYIARVRYRLIPLIW